VRSFEFMYLNVLSGNILTYKTPKTVLLLLYARNDFHKIFFCIIMSAIMYINFKLLCRIRIGG